MKHVSIFGAVVASIITMFAIGSGGSSNAWADTSEVTFADVLQFKASTPCERVDAEIDESFPASFQSIWRDARALCQIEAPLPTSLDTLTWHNPRVATLSSGSNFHVFVVSEDAPTLCCSIWSESLKQVDGMALWVASFRVQDLDKASFSFEVHDRDGQKIADTVFYGGGQFAPPGFEGVIRRFSLEDPKNDERRQIFVYFPPEDLVGPAERTVVLLDGESIFDFAYHIEKAISADGLSPIAVIGLTSGPFAIEGNTTGGIRSQEYRPGTREDSPRFDNYVDFVTKTVIPWAGSDLSLPSTPEAMTIAGFSDGAQFAAWMLKEHAASFRSAIIMSPGEQVAKLSDPLPADAIAYVSAGLYEPAFLSAARATRKRFEDAGVTVALQIVHAGHDTSNWTHALIKGLYATENAPNDTSD